MPLRVIRVAECTVTILLLNSVPHDRHTSFHHLPVEGHLGCFKCLAIANEAPINTHRNAPSAAAGLSNRYVSCHEKPPGWVSE